MSYSDEIKPLAALLANPLQMAIKNIGNGISFQDYWEHIENSQMLAEPIETDTLEITDLSNQWKTIEKMLDSLEKTKTAHHYLHLHFMYANKFMLVYLSSEFYYVYEDDKENNPYVIDMKFNTDSLKELKKHLYIKFKHVLK